MAGRPVTGIYSQPTGGRVPKLKLHLVGRDECFQRRGCLIVHSLK
jgi:hypothetical protein